MIRGGVGGDGDGLGDTLDAVALRPVVGAAAEEDEASACRASIFLISLASGSDIMASNISSVEAATAGAWARCGCCCVLGCRGEVCGDLCRACLAGDNGALNKDRSANMGRGDISRKDAYEDENGAMFVAGVGVVGVGLGSDLERAGPPSEPL